MRRWMWVGLVMLMGCGEKAGEVVPASVPVITPLSRPSDPPTATIQEEYDEFEKETKYRIEDIYADYFKVWIFTTSKEKGKPSPLVTIMFSRVNERRQYDECSTVSLLVDGDKVEISPLTKYDSSGGSGKVAEHVTLIFPDNSILRKLAGAKAVKWKVCNDVIKWQPGHITAVYDLYIKATAK